MRDLAKVWEPKFVSGFTAGCPQMNRNGAIAASWKSPIARRELDARTAFRLVTIPTRTFKIIGAGLDIAQAAFR